ncbi:MAG: hypothetical protein EZS28_040617 [Streblomastix strix]|uniref:Uncharacterized protein n=1 Tax=Streblomastix strix TaxID=222440 RepID=A0A5J4TZJ0_9EUKA|nr:MAG: hypothetical protein EZS28_040617 [Streblomastix strix]
MSLTQMMSCIQETSVTKLKIFEINQQIYEELDCNLQYIIFTRILKYKLKYNNEQQQGNKIIIRQIN